MAQPRQGQGRGESIPWSSWKKASAAARGRPRKHGVTIREKAKAGRSGFSNACSLLVV
jgi:hypothetical protein